MSLAVDVISDVIRPWCYVGKRWLEKATAAFEGQVAVRWLPFRLNPAMPKVGVSRREYRTKKFGNWERSQELDARVVAVGQSAAPRAAATSGSASGPAAATSASHERQTSERQRPCRLNCVSPSVAGARPGDLTSRKAGQAIGVIPPDQQPAAVVPVDLDTITAPRGSRPAAPGALTGAPAIEEQSAPGRDRLGVGLPHCPAEPEQQAEANSH